MVEKVDKNKKQRRPGRPDSPSMSIQKTAQVEQDPEPIAKGLS